MQRVHLDQLIGEIKESPLLTDEDLQLLNSAMSDSTHISDDHTHSSSWPSPVLFLFLPLLVVGGWCWLHPLTLTVGVALPLLLFLMFCLLSHCLNQMLLQAQAQRQQHYADMDRLLTQLTVTIRWLQEVEIVSRGLTRPLPIGRLDHGHTHKLLRRRVLWTCTEVVRLLRAATRRVCQSYDLRMAPELEEEEEGGRGYLAFTPLHELHQFMAEEGVGGGEGEGREEEDCLSLHSIKVCTVNSIQLQDSLYSNNSFVSRKPARWWQSKTRSC